MTDYDILFQKATLLGLVINLVMFFKKSHSTDFTYENQFTKGCIIASVAVKELSKV